MLETIDRYGWVTGWWTGLGRERRISLAACAAAPAPFYADRAYPRDPAMRHLRTYRPYRSLLPPGAPDLQ